MSEIAYAEAANLSFIITESGFGDNPGWELRAYDVAEVEVSWTSHSSRDSAVEAFLRKIKEALTVSVRS
jgi:hypothetical protein